MRRRLRTIHRLVGRSAEGRGGGAVTGGKCANNYDAGISLGADGTASVGVFAGIVT